MTDLEMLTMEVLARLRKRVPPQVANRIRNSAVNVIGRVFPRPLPHRPEGVSVLMRVRDEEWWIRPSILSLRGLASEYVIVDGSSDRTPEIIESLRRDDPLTITHILDHGEDIVGLSNKALERTRYRWILRWDGDFIAKDEMPKVVQQLMQSLDPFRYYVVEWPHICLDGDVFHQDPRAPLHTEHWLATWTPGIRFVKVPHGCEYLYVPPHRAKRIHLDQPLSFHLRTVKPAKRLLLRKYWGDLMEKELLGRTSLENWAKAHIGTDFGTESMEEAASRFLDSLLGRLRPYPRGEFGDYPSLLKEQVLALWGIDVDRVEGEEAGHPASAGEVER